jgi:hypothetical protein
MTAKSTPLPARELLADPHDPAQVVIVGNALASMVAATERADCGLPTTVINPAGPWGGYFAGLRHDDETWDVGMVLYEFTSFRSPAEAPRLSTYDPSRRNDIGRFTQAVKDYVTRHQRVHDIAAPQMWTGDAWLPDLVLGNHVESVRDLPCSAAAREELAALVDRMQDSPLHARRKDEWPISGPVLYDELSRLNHGRVLHEAIFAPFARQVMGRGDFPVAGLFHRVPWLPLYWPETLLAALEGHPAPFPPTRYSHPIGLSVADLCTQLLTRMKRDPLITLRSEGIERLRVGRCGFSLELCGGDRVHTDRLVWAQSPRQALRALGADLPPTVEERLPLTLTLLRVPRAALCRDFSIAHVASELSGVYRITNRSHCAADHAGHTVQLVVEAHPERLSARHPALRSQTDSASTTRAVLADLAAIGLLRSETEATQSHVLRLAGALPLPTPASLAAYAQEHAEMLRRAPTLETLASSAGPYTTSLSDQIVQGLRLAEAVCAPTPTDLYDSHSAGVIVPSYA